MKLAKTSATRRLVASLLIVGHLVMFSGCATFAHRSSASGHRVRSTANCSGEGDVCPWLLGDAGLLLLGVVPGVIAFIVDLGTGAWRHTDLQQVQAMTMSDEVASAYLLFNPARARSESGAPVLFPAPPTPNMQKTGTGLDGEQPSSLPPYHPLSFVSYCPKYENP